MTFLVITLSYMVIDVIYCQIQPHFYLIPTKMPRKNLFVALGVHLHPLHSLHSPATPMCKNAWGLLIPVPSHSHIAIPVPIPSHELPNP